MQPFTRAIICGTTRQLLARAASTNSVVEGRLWSKGGEWGVSVQKVPHRVQILVLGVGLGEVSR